VNRGVNRSLPVALLAVALAGCAGGLPGSGRDNDAAKSVAGRWLLTAPNAPPCGMTFSEGGEPQGKVTPDGGCPATFYRSRRWIFDQAVLTVLDDGGETLGQLTWGGGQFQGKAMNGTPVSLTRPAIPTAQ